MTEDDFDLQLFVGFDDFENINGPIAMLEENWPYDIDFEFRKSQQE